MIEHFLEIDWVFLHFNSEAPAKQMMGMLPDIRIMLHVGPSGKAEGRLAAPPPPQTVFGSLPIPVTQCYTCSPRSCIR